MLRIVMFFAVAFLPFAGLAARIAVDHFRG